MPPLAITMLTIAAILLAHAPIFFTAAQWHYNCIPIIWNDWDAYLERAANPPWYIRYTNWLEAKIFKPTARRLKR